MPILTDEEPLEDQGLIIRVPNLPDFNAGDPAFRINNIGGWYDAAKPDAVLVANGGGPGAVPVGAWQDAEAYYTLEGRFYGSDRGTADSLRSLLLSGLPTTSEASVQVLGGVADKQILVRRYDEPKIVPIGPHGRRFVVPLVASSPHKYGITPLTAIAGGFQSQDWFRVYEEDAGDWYRTYAPDGSVHYRSYIGEEVTTAYPKVATIDSPGDVQSRLMTITVTGPLTAGDWFIEDAETTQRLWANVSLAAGQSVVFDCQGRTALLGGSSIDHLVFGDYLALQPGPNSFRLITADDQGAYMSLEALEAYR